MQPLSIYLFIYLLLYEFSSGSYFCSWNCLWDLHAHCTRSVWGIAQIGKNGFTEKKEVLVASTDCAFQWSFTLEYFKVCFLHTCCSTVLGAVQHIFQAGITWREPSSLLSVEGSWGIASEVCFSSGLSDASMHLAAKTIQWLPHCSVSLQVRQLSGDTCWCPCSTDVSSSVLCSIRVWAVGNACMHAVRLELALMVLSSKNVLWQDTAYLPATSCSGKLGKFCMQVLGLQALLHVVVWSV